MIYNIFNINNFNGKFLYKKTLYNYSLNSSNKTVFSNFKLGGIVGKKGAHTIKKFVVNFGPQHPAAHGVLRLLCQLSGEVIEGVDIHIGLLHRGTEYLIESKKFLSNLPYFDRLDYVSMLVQEHAYCLAVEGTNFKENSSYLNLKLRTIFDELTRVLNHLLAISCHALDVGSMSTLFWAFEEREYIMEFYERLSGARMHAAFYKPFDYTFFLKKSFCQDILLFMRKAKKSLNEIHNVLTYNKVWKQRLVNIGVLSKRDCISYSVTGVLARSSGCKMDLRLVRSLKSYGCYSSIKFRTFLGGNGDCYDRYLLRLSEIIESFSIVNRVILGYIVYPKLTSQYDRFGSVSSKAYHHAYASRPISIYKFLNSSEFKKYSKTNNFIKMSKLLRHFKSWTSGISLKPNILYRSVESPKGEFGVQLVTTGSSTIFRAKIRSSSYFHLRLLSKISKGHFLTDLVTLIGSIDIVFGEIDR